MISQMAAYSVASFQPDDAALSRRLSFDLQEADELSNAIIKARLLLRSLAKGSRLWVIAAVLLALTVVARLVADATLVANGELDGSAAVVSLILSILVFGFGATALVAALVTFDRIPKILNTLEAGTPLVLGTDSHVSFCSTPPEP